MNKEEFMALAGQRDDILAKLQEHDNFYDQGKAPEAIMIDLTRELLAASIGSLSG